MPRPSVTPWSPFARGYQCTIRRPYQDLEVLPCGDRWSWSVVAIDPATGLFRTSARGVADTLSSAKAAAMDAAARPG